MTILLVNKTYYFKIVSSVSYDFFIEKFVAKKLFGADSICEWKVQEPFVQNEKKRVCKEREKLKSMLKKNKRLSAKRVTARSQISGNFYFV